MVDSLFLVPLEIFFYGLGLTVCWRVWALAQALLVAGYVIQSLTAWVQTDIFGPSIDQVSFISDGLLPLFATVAVWVLAFSYLASPLMKIRVVDWKKALGWFVLATIFFQYGPGLYLEAEHLRRQLGSTFYSVVIERAEEADGHAALGRIHAAQGEIPMGELENQFAYIFHENDQYIDGLDIAMAYTLSGSADVLEPVTELPQTFSDAFFPPEADTEYWLDYSNEVRLNYIGMEIVGIFRLLLGFVLIFFGVMEQLIYLCLAISAGILFIDLMIALPFALFERTELMARSILDMMLELFIFTAIIATLQALVIGVITVAAETLNPTLAFGAAAMGLIFEVVLLLRAVGTITDSSKRMFQAMSQVVGGRIMSPGEAAMAGMTAAGAAAVGLATAGVGAVGTLAATGSLASAAGAAMSGSNQLFNTAALGQMALPEGSALKEKLSGFYEGALAQRMMPGMGGLLLRKDGKVPKEHAQAEASAEGMREAASRQAAADRLPAGGQQDIRFDSADLVQLRETLATALAAAIRATPPGGYGSAEQALTAIESALSALGRSPRSDPAMGAHLARQEKGAVGYVMTGNLSLTEQAEHAGAPGAKGSNGGGSPPAGPSHGGQAPVMPSLGDPAGPLTGSKHS